MQVLIVFGWVLLGILVAYVLSWLILTFHLPVESAVHRDRWNVFLLTLIGWLLGWIIGPWAFKLLFGKDKPAIT